MPILEVNISDAFENVANVIKSKSKEISREISNAVSTVMAERIFTKGIASDGTQIGTYSSKYLKYREKNYPHPTDPIVTVSLTRQLENNFGVVEADNESYGIGVIDSEIGAKMGYVESIKDKTISDMTDEESELAAEAASKALERYLNENL